MKITFDRLNHIQICIPVGKEDKARRFYCDILGLEEIEKPEDLKANGGFWLKVNDIQIHIGTEDSKRDSSQHPAFEVLDLEKVRHYLANKNVKIKQHKPIPDFNRFSIFDYWGNRIELMQKI